MSYDNGPTLADRLLHNPLRSENTKLKERIAELEECLRQTRTIVSSCAMTGFIEAEFIHDLFTNNGAITRLVPLRPEDREESDKHFRVIDDTYRNADANGMIEIKKPGISLRVGTEYNLGNGGRVLICEEVKDEFPRFYDANKKGYLPDGRKMFSTDPANNIVSVYKPD
jgi:hypothetical protein